MSTIEETQDVCVIAFAGDAHEQAADAVRATETYVAEVTIAEDDGDANSGTQQVVIGPVSVDNDGFYVVELYPWNEEKGDGDHARAFKVDLYRMERLLIV